MYSLYKIFLLGSNETKYMTLTKHGIGDYNTSGFIHSLVLANQLNSHAHHPRVTHISVNQSQFSSFFTGL